MPGLFERFSRTAERFPGLVSLQIKEDAGIRSLTFKEVHDNATATGQYLIYLGINKGDMVAIFGENSPEWCIAYLGVASIGAVAVPLDALYTKEEVRNLLRDSESKAVFVSKTLFPLVEAATEGMGLKSIPMDNIPILLKGGERGPVDNDDLASLLYTSGTTGFPKGVMLTHSNLLSNAEALAGTGIVSHNDHVLCALPLHHTYPFMVCFLVPMLVGGKVTFLNSLKGPDIVETIRDAGVTVLVGVPQLYSLMRKGIFGKIDSLPRWKRLITKTLFTISMAARKSTGINTGRVIFGRIHREFGKSLRFFACGGAKLDPFIAFDLEGLGFTILEGYGLTETSPVVTINLPKGKKIGSVGRVIEQVEVRIENPDTSGVGEIIVKGPNIMKGYYRRPDTTSEVIKEGWFHSGDLGFIDSDGFLFITGRSKEVIVLGSGKNVYPEDVENHFLKSPYIKEVCIIGIPDPYQPESFAGIKALIFPNIERLAADGIASISDQIRWQIEKLSASLPQYKRVSGFSILKEPLPRTHLGKIRRFLVRDEEVVAGFKPAPTLSDEDQRLMDSDVAKVVLNAISLVTDRKISVNSSLELDLGIDSLGRVELMVALENGLGVSIPETFPSGVPTVKDLIYKTIEYTAGKAGLEALKRPVSWGDILQQAPSKEMIERISLKRGVISNLSLQCVAFLIYLASRILLRLEVRGIENVPMDRACIVAPNHVSYIDGFVVGAVIRKRLPKLYAVGFRGFFQGIATSLLARWGHIISIDADSGLSESLQASAYVLKEGVALIVFPEGGRSTDGRILPFKKGVGILAKELKVPLIPTYIEGSLDVLPRGARIPRLKKITVTFGKPLVHADIREADYQGITDRLREMVVTLKG